MSVVDLHPEDLIDKLAAGELTSTERGRLNAHLRQCSVCRLEIGLRDELAEEMPALEPRPQLSFPSALERTAAAPRTAALRPRARRRWPLSMLAAALVLCAGGAAAAVLSGAVQPHWLRRWVPEPNSTSAPRATQSTKAAAKAKRIPLALQRQSALDSPPVLDAKPSATALPAPIGSAPLLPTPAPAIHATAATALAPSLARAVNPIATRATPPATRATPPAAEADSHVDSPPRLDPAAALFAEANRARRDGNADRALTLYRALQTRYPSSAESTLSRALVAQLLLDRGRPEAALAGFDRYLAAGTPVLSAEALVGRARALEQLNQPAQAAAAWREVQQRFPGSIHARLAATRLVALGTR